MTIKLVVSDMDGTLIDRDEILTERAVNIVDKLNQKGIYFTVATGRVECMAQEYIDKLGIKIPYIACNGATIIWNGKTIIRNQVPAKGLKEILLKADQMGMSIIYTIQGKEFVFRPTSWILGQREKFNRYYDEHLFTEEEWENLLIDKVTIMDDIRDGRITLVEDMCKDLDEDYCFTRYTDKAVEIVEKSSNKASAIKTVAQLLEIELEEIMVIGDHQNDIEMLQEAGLGVAVSNATEAAKEAANYICENRCTEGVIEALNKFCIGL